VENNPFNVDWDWKIHRRPLSQFVVSAHRKPVVGEWYKSEYGGISQDTTSTKYYAEQLVRDHWSSGEIEILTPIDFPIPANHVLSYYEAGYLDGYYNLNPNREWKEERSGYYPDKYSKEYTEWSQGYEDGFNDSLA
jgi:hypothetical protein